MNKALKFHDDYNRGDLLNDREEFTADMSNVIEFEAWKRDNKVMLKPKKSNAVVIPKVRKHFTDNEILQVFKTALLVREYDPKMIKKRRDGSLYLYGIRLGANIREAYMEVLKRW